MDVIVQWVRACLHRSKVVIGVSLALLFGVVPASGYAQSVNAICSMQVDWCNAIKSEYEKQTGGKVNLALKSAGEALAQLVAEKGNPKTDIWIGGTGDPHLQAGEQDLTVSYQSPHLVQLHDWARKQAEQSSYRTVGLYAGALGIGYNAELIKKNKLPVPACWKDLLATEYKGELQMSNPNSSGTAYVVIATLVQIMGEEEAFKYLIALHKNINQYSRSGAGPVKAVARGESSVSINFLHDGVGETVSGFPVKNVVPCEGTGYEIGSMSLVKNAKNSEGAKKLYDWALLPAAQKLGGETKSYQVPSNKESAVPPQAPRFADIKLIDYNFAKYGSAAERKRLIARWDKEVASAKK
jgi:iron(III) transport system substrate-binding protein